MSTRRRFMEASAVAGAALLAAPTRAEYLNNLFTIINWDNVAARFDAARA